MLHRIACAMVAAGVLALSAQHATAGEVARVHAPDGRASIAVDRIATALGWSFRRTATGALLDDGTVVAVLRVGSRDVREDGVDRPQFDLPVSVQNGRVAVSIADAARVFHLRVAREGENVVLFADEGARADIREIPRPLALAAPSPPASPLPQRPAAPSPVLGNAGTLTMSVVFDGKSRTYQTTAASSGGWVHGALSSYGTDTFGAPVGAVTLGEPAANVAFGSINDPLSGIIIRNGAFQGADGHIATAGAAYDVFSGHRFDGRGLIAVERTRGTATDALAIVGGGNGFAGAVARHDVEVAQPWGRLGYEVLAGTRGTATGFHATTSGKTFLDATASVAAGTLPLSEGDLPTGIVIGHVLSPATTVTAGYVRSANAPAGATVGFSTRLAGVTLATNVSRHWTNVTANVAGALGYAQLYAFAGQLPVIGIRGAASFAHALGDLDVNRSGGTSTGIAQLRTDHAGINAAAGLSLSDGRVLPLVGLVASLTPALALEAAVVPGSSGRAALRVSLLAGFRSRRPRTETFPFAVRVVDGGSRAGLRLFLDGTPNDRLRDGRAQLALAPGRHVLAVETSDREYGSLPITVIAGIDRSSDLTLIPERTIAGRIRFDANVSAADTTRSLEGIRVVIEPTGASVVSDADGSFVFARQPYDPETHIVLDPETVPPGMAAPPALQIAEGETAVVLEPMRKTERTTFH